jgi:uncharacterized protein YhdP
MPTLAAARALLHAEHLWRPSAVEGRVEWRWRAEDNNDVAMLDNWVNEASELYPELADAWRSAAKQHLLLPAVTRRGRAVDETAQVARRLRYELILR